MNSLAISKRSLAIGLIAAFAMAFILAMGMATPAHAAQKKPYAGYKIADEYPIYDAAGNVQRYIEYIATKGSGSIVIENVGDTRGVKKGFLDGENSFTVWSGDKYVAPLSDFNGNAYNDDGTPTADSRTYVLNTSQFKKIKGVKKLKGMSYSKKKNTLTLKNVKAPAYNLVISGMGKGFKIALKGKNQLAGIQIKALDKDVKYLYKDQYGNIETRWSSTGYYPCNVKIDGTGTLAINKKTYNNTPITLNGGGGYSKWNAAKQTHDNLSAYTKSKLTITKKPGVQIYAYGASPSVTAMNSAAKKPISIGGLSGSALDSASVKVAAQSRYEMEDVRIQKSASDTTYVDLEYAMKLNNGAFYGVADSKAAWYYDTKTRQRYYSKWKIYKKVGMYDEYDPAVVYFGKVGNNKDCPKGYTPVLLSKDKAHYTYTIKNNKLVSGS